MKTIILIFCCFIFLYGCNDDNNINNNVHMSTPKATKTPVKEVEKQGENLEDAINVGDIVAVKKLIEQGISVNSKAGVNLTILIVACEKGHFEVVKYLVETGADINYVGNRQMNALMAASGKGHFEIVKYLVEKGADINITTEFGSPISYAAMSNNLKIIKFLVDNGANKLNMYGSHIMVGATALHSSAENNNIEIAKYFIAKDFDIDIPDKFDTTPLMLAAARGHYEFFEFLIENNADLNKIDMYGKTALDYAIKNNHIEIINLIKNL